jgi:hypothetical protein
VLQELEQEIEPKRVELEVLSLQLQEQDSEMVEELKRTQVSLLHTHCPAACLLSDVILT